MTFSLSGSAYSIKNVRREQNSPSPVCFPPTKTQKTLYKPAVSWYNERNRPCPAGLPPRGAKEAESVNIPKISVGDILTLKKQHPCGSLEFEVLRVGSDIRMICRGCGRDLTLPREKVEKAIKKITAPTAGEETP